VLATASWDFVRFAAGRWARILAYGMPVWVVQLLLVVGFALIAVRLLWHAGDRWRWRGAALLLAAVLVGIALWAPVEARACAGRPWRAAGVGRCAAPRSSPGSEGRR
jgi:hypothetical protein